jgi:hypothetical protein
MNLLADIDGHLTYPGDTIILTDIISGIDEALFTEGVVTEKEGKFYLGERELWLLDVFKITKHGTRAA